jgi:hypothetical protein
MNDSGNAVLDAAITNFFHASTLTGSTGDILELVFLGLTQVANVVANQVSDSSAQVIANAASTNFSQANFALGSNATPGDLQNLALGLQQLTGAMKALN